MSLCYVAFKRKNWTWHKSCLDFDKVHLSTYPSLFNSYSPWMLTRTNKKKPLFSLLPSPYLILSFLLLLPLHFFFFMALDSTRYDRRYDDHIWLNKKMWIFYFIIIIKFQLVIINQALLEIFILLLFIVMRIRTGLGLINSILLSPNVYYLSCNIENKWNWCIDIKLLLIFTLPLSILFQYINASAIINLPACEITLPQYILKEL